ncbi:extracellular solute-binding protein [Paraburkholderia haematera]|jgi:Spermidine/putrescine-binding periplasmic protein|uniref:Putrescine-binding periplasmic protein n=1 Tax=Paraburkholderia haematera TaxID=2793077 RepID=A0ABN7L0X8_9BURK|nr:extracellular solute-binding protein [Paraburkholderia haematera]CAE6717393.1 Spermidine/putrescine-binding periplasmic protein [Paraburkholderia haematera]
MKKFLSTTGVVLACVAPAMVAHAAGTLNLYTWSGYVAPDLIAQFQQQTGIKVNIDNYDSAETLLAKLKQGGAGYDIAVSGQEMVPVLVREGLIQKIDATSIPGYNNIDARFRKPQWDPSGDYSVPYVWGTMNFAVDTGAYNGDINSWKVLFDPPAQLRGKLNMFDSANDAIALAALYVGVPFCSEDPKQMQKVLDVLKQQKPFVKTYSSKAGAIRESMVSGEIAMSAIWSGTAQRATDLRRSIRYAYPKEGSVAWVDNVVVPKGAPDLENAKKFIAFLLTPKAAAMNTNFLKYQNAIDGSDAYVANDVKGAPAMSPPAGTKLVFEQQACSVAAIRLHDRVWTDLLK